MEDDHSVRGGRADGEIARIILKALSFTMYDQNIHHTGEAGAMGGRCRDTDGQGGGASFLITKTSFLRQPTAGGLGALRAPENHPPSNKQAVSAYLHAFPLTFLITYLSF